MENIIIITGHGKYASGIISAMELLSGIDNSVLAIDFTEGDDEVSLENKYREILKKYSREGFLFVCDLLGGTPYKIAAKLSFEMSNIRVVTGVNLGGLIACNLKKDKLNIDELALTSINVSQKGLLLFTNESKPNIKDGI